MRAGAASDTCCAPMEVGDADRLLADRAVAALRDELAAWPKPGLVSPVDRGSHRDMDFALMQRSAEALRAPFAALAAAGRAGASFEGGLLPLGIAAERRMLQATGGVNTHRGAIFALGLTVAGLARAETVHGRVTPAILRTTLQAGWGAALRTHAARGQAALTHGARVRRETGRGGARDEAALGFPSVFDVGLPAHRAALQAGLDANAARIQTLFALMAAVDDTTVLHRGGLEGAAFVRRAAARFLAEGGCHQPGWEGRGVALHEAFVARNLSAGGCADLLATTLLVAGSTQEANSPP
ncbi:MAG: triphosphoribosyl-dephospho-CoA synthase [Reyranellaceae bacterium]